MPDIKTKPKSFLQVVGILILILIVLKVLIPKPDIRKEIADIKRRTAPNLDSFNNQLIAENRFLDSIQYLISSGRLIIAEEITNQLLAKDSTNAFYLTLKGQIYDARGKYDSAIAEYTMALWHSAYPNTLDKRAISFIKTRRYNEAIEDYKSAYAQNNSFSYKLAQSFEINRQSDSALKYYNIYLQDYSDSVYQILKQSGIRLEYPPDSAIAKIHRLKRAN